METSTQGSAGSKMILRVVARILKNKLFNLFENCADFVKINVNISHATFCTLSFFIS